VAAAPAAADAGARFDSGIGVGVGWTPSSSLAGWITGAQAAISPLVPASAESRNS
jgi:hypothetical protein